MCDELKNDFIDSLLDNRELVINKEINDSLIEDVVLRIKQWNDQDTLIEGESKKYKRDDHPIKIYINTPGGHVDSMFSCISAIATSRTPVHTYCLGKAYSAGFLIFVAGHKRYAQMYSRFMIHQLSYGERGELQAHEETFENEFFSQELMDNFIITRTKITKKRLDEIRKTKTDWYLYACEQQVKKLKIFDEFF